jgi:large subunit ribosomal protein L24
MMLAKKYNVKKGDTVVVITGKDKIKSGKVLKILSKKDRVLVEGLNIIKRHTKAQGNQVAGIVEKEAAIHISNIMLFCGVCKKPVRTKVSLLDDGVKTRVCIKCGESFDK